MKTKNAWHTTALRNGLISTLYIAFEPVSHREALSLYQAAVAEAVHHKNSGLVMLYEHGDGAYTVHCHNRNAGCELLMRLPSRSLDPAMFP